MKLKIYLRSKFILLFIPLIYSSCNERTPNLIAGDEYKIWDLQDTSSNGVISIVGCYYFTRKGHCAYFMYSENPDRKEKRVDVQKGSDYDYKRTWHVIDARTIEFTGFPCRIIKINEDTLQLYCKDYFRRPNFFMVKSKDQTRIAGYNENK
jgi:hypothetical protein